MLESPLIEGALSGLQPRVLLFAPECFPPAGAEAIVTAKLVLAALKAGWAIDVICQRRAGQYYPAMTSGIWAPLRPVVHEIDPAKGGVPRKLQSLNWVRQATALGHRLLKRQRYDVILSRIMPQYGHMPALALSKLYNIPWVANWSDPMPRQKAPPPYGGGPDATVPKLMTWYCRAAARQAAWHTFPCDRLRNHFIASLPECGVKGSVIPHLALSRPVEQGVGQTKIFSLCHTGGMGLRKPDTFLQGIKLFLMKVPAWECTEVRFIGPNEETLPELARSLELQDIVHIEPRRSYEDSLSALEAAAVSVVIEAPMTEGIFFPSKVADYVQVGRPILAVSPAVGTMNDLLSRYGGGIAVDCTSPTAIAKGIESLFRSWQAGDLDVSYGSARLRPLFSDGTVLSAYREIFDRIQMNPTGVYQ
jgi:glycosyltransferase involved in cell wall biosynthesis